MGGSIGHMCCMGGLLDIGVLYGGGLLDICAVWGSIGHRCTVWGGLLDIGVLYGGVYWT